MRIGILNLFYSNKNYGAVLQAYALQTFLEEIGVDAWIVNFKPKINTNVLTTITDFIIRKNPFEKFRKIWLKPITMPFYTLRELNDADFLGFHGFIVGSDQVWRPKYNFEPLAYFLPFVKKDAHKIAYAASFGVDSWEYAYTDELTKEIQSLLKEFDFISVREDSGVRICKETFNVDAKQTLDPTLLVGRVLFDRVIGSKFLKEKRIVSFKLDNNEEFNKSLVYLSEVTGLGTKNLNPERRSFFGKEYMHFLEVKEWLSSIRESELVVTDSYHCLCFAILFHRQFIYFSNDERGMSRIESLLGKLDLMERIYYSLDELMERNTWQENIDFGFSDKILQGERDTSMQFLLNAVHSCTNV